MNISTRLAQLPLLAGLALVVPTTARAQVDAGNATTRAEVIAAEQAAKAKDLKPYTPSGIERRVQSLQNLLIEQPGGLYPLFDSVYSGGGFTLGAGYRQFYGDRTHADLKGLYSISNYKLVEVSTDSWGHAQGRLDLHARVGWRDATQVAFHGVGLDSPEEYSDFRMKQGYVGGDAVFRPGGFMVFGAGLASEAFTLESGTGDTPSIEEVHTPESAPGLDADPTYLHTTLTAGIDSRPSAGYARRGGLYAVTYHNYADRDDTYSFDLVNGEAVQHIPILRENWVISLHGEVQTTLDDNDIVPHFLLPSLGSGSTLRGYSSWRFRDRHSLLMSAEWRWIPSRLALDMALFYDTGKVGARWEDLNLKGLKSDFGIGIRLHSPLATPLRIELAKGSEGMRLVFAGSAAF